MSQKKYKKRHSQSTMNAKRQAAQAKLADEKDRARKRMDPTARNLLLGNLVFLAASQMLYTNGMMSDTVNAITSIIGIILLFVALWFQFGKKKRDGRPRGGGDWPDLY